MLACAKIFMASAATALNRLGVVMVGAVGQVTRITGGMSSGWMSSMVIVSFGDWVSWSSTRVVVSDTGSRFRTEWDFWPVGSCTVLAGRLFGCVCRRVSKLLGIGRDDR